MIKINIQKMSNGYIVYLLQDMQGHDVFSYWCKFADAFKLHALVRNPAFDITQDYNFYVMGFYETQAAAINAHSELLRARGWPELNLTTHHNRLGSIRCNETGFIYRNQAEVVLRHGIDSSTLSHHLRREPGYKTIKGMTFSRAAYRKDRVEGVTEQPAQLHYVPRSSKAVRCNETGAWFKSQRAACEAMGLNAGQLSQHLRGHAGYKTVKGYTFATAEQAPQPQAINYTGTPPQVP